MNAESECSYESDAYYYRKKYIHKIRHEPFRIRSYFLQNAEGFTAALIFKFLVRKFHSVLKPLGKHLSAKFLNNNIQKIILKIFGYTANHSNTYGGKQQPHYTVVRFKEKVCLAIVPGIFGVIVCQVH